MNKLFPHNVVCKSLALSFALTMTLSAQDDPREEPKEEPTEDPRDEPSKTADCNGLGETTTISNGRYYAQTEPDDPIIGGGSAIGPSPAGTYVDPGLSIISNISNTTGLLVGSSMRLQSTSSGTTGVYAGVTTKASCVTTASLSVPAWGGSSRTFWDTNSGVTPDATSFPIAGAYNTLNGDIYSCWNNGGSGFYDFTYTLDFSSRTTVDGVYWETFGPLGSGLTGSGPGNTYQVLIDGVAAGSSTGTPFLSSTVTDSNGQNVENLNHFYVALGQTLTGNHTITVRSTGPLDPVMGDFAIMGCCPTPVPEPSSAILLVSGCGILLSRRKR